mgnify:CR=1 FL=1
MANVFKMMQQANSMRKEMKRIEKELQSKVVEVTEGGGLVTVGARGDMIVTSIKIDPKLLTDQAKLEKLLTAGVNNALAKAKAEAGKEMGKLAQGGGLADLLGGLGG